ncbi:MAG: hypothetical protein J4F39_18290 [Candidatus Latescibacteria bacterium]|nr:hypothetical protein [Candidatus Latescibacterota bacterium]
MNLCFRRIFVVILVALAWAVVWSPVGVLTGIIVDPGGSMDEMWVAIGAYPGFLCGAVFSAVMGIAEGRRRLNETVLSRVAAWGAVSGLVVGVIPFVLGTVNSALPLWLWSIVTVGAVTILSSASAVGTASIARMAKKRALHGASGDAV